MLGLAWARPRKTWQSGSIIFLGKIIPHGDTFLAPSSLRDPCSDGGWCPAGASPWCVMGLDPAWGCRAGVSLPPRAAPLGQAASLPSVPMPGVEQEDFHCC